jgi:hypothetical protein
MPDAPYWNRKGKYVRPLAAAARSLVALRLVEVFAEPIAIGDGYMLTLDEALAAVSETGGVTIPKRS